MSKQLRFTPREVTEAVTSRPLRFTPIINEEAQLEDDEGYLKTIIDLLHNLINWLRFLILARI